MRARKSCLDWQRWIVWVSGPPHSGIALFSIDWVAHPPLRLCQLYGRRTRGLCEHRVVSLVPPTDSVHCLDLIIRAASLGEW